MTLLLKEVTKFIILVVVVVVIVAAIVGFCTFLFALRWRHRCTVVVVVVVIRTFITIQCLFGRIAAHAFHGRFHFTDGRVGSATHIFPINGGSHFLFVRILL